ncbi:hypothetical protein JO972_16560 [Verrucomicrobiaceae bacterium 5K15]|uniref:Uncharacterized protein n=1 Tax=Oceaniferula flava TaxID=2800421 RepID=A0AAE2SGR6_9BACT|nr:hypothetical protein [Oceaniferula flavus]MBK1856584.1 hypothetical protein [Oceaniferula flavus]MBM1137891.1 hypothetical protein [Oceaniferula flavus]
MKKSVMIIAVFCGGLIAGLFFDKLSSYYRMPGIWNQGESIVEKIEQYKENVGRYPDQQWFTETIPDVVTSEGHEWLYLNIEPSDSKGKTLLIATWIEYGDSFYAVYSGGLVRKVDLDTLTNKN